MEDIDLADWERTLAICLTSQFIGVSHAVSALRESGNASIVNFSSVAGRDGFPLRSPYAAAKWAINGLTKTLAMELGPTGVRVNAICPGAVEGDRMDRVVAMESAASGLGPDEVRALYVRGVSLRSWVTAEEVAETVLWLSSPAARKISGQILAIDGHTETLAP